MSSSPPLRLLFVAHGDTSLSEMLPLARYLRDEKHVEVSFVSADPSASAEREKLQAAGFEPLTLPVVEARNCCPLEARLQSLMRSWGRTNLADLLFWRLEFRRKLTQCRDLLERVTPDAVVVYGDNNISLEVPLIAECRRRRIATFVLPIAVSQPEFWAKNRSVKGPLYRPASGLWHRIFIRVNKAQVFRYAGVTYLFYPRPVMYALWTLGLLVKHPWTFGSHARTVLASGTLMQSDYIRRGVSAKKIRITGQFSHDSLLTHARNASARRAELLGKYGFAEEDKIAIVALPQLAEHNLATWEDHTSEIAHLCESLEKAGVKAILSLHPKMRREKYVQLEVDGLRRIADERLSEILAVGDLFVAAFESTVHWAVLLRKPSVFLAYLKLGYDLSSFQSVVSVVDRNALVAAIQRALARQLPAAALDADIEKVGSGDSCVGEAMYREFLQAARAR